MREFADQITDPTRKKRVAGFIGQESVHGQKHRRLNQQLVEDAAVYLRPVLSDAASARAGLVTFGPGRNQFREVAR